MTKRYDHDDVELLKLARKIEDQRSETQKLLDEQIIRLLGIDYKKIAQKLEIVDDKVISSKNIAQSIINCDTESNKFQFIEPSENSSENTKILIGKLML